MSVDLRDSIVTRAEILSFGGNQKVAENYLNAKVLLWTEDCWKLEGANGVTFNPTISYLLVKHNSDYLILAEKRLGEFIARVGNGKSESFKTLLVLSG